jgi:cyanophycinase-like exopeptidase
LGVVIDEDTVLMLKGSRAEVIGVGSVVLVDPAKNKVNPYIVLKAGDARDIAK